MHQGLAEQRTDCCDLTDPATFANDRFIETLARLRQDEPVHFHTQIEGPGFWVVTRHADVSYVYANADLFSSRLGMRLGGDADAVKAVSDRMLIVTDNPEHARVRHLVGSAFTPPVIRTLDMHVKAVVRELMDTVIALGPRDFVASVARPLATYVICAFMDLPRTDWEWISRLTTEGLDSDNDDDRLAANTDLFMYFTEIIEQRRGHPGSDLISIVTRAAAASAMTGAPGFSDLDVIINLVGILIGANETTRYAVAGGLVAFTEHPDQWALLQRDPDLVASTVEEILRWVSPAVHAMRTVTQQTRLGGRILAASDRVAVWSHAANRDPAVFAAPNVFNIARKPNQHLSFGNGRHVCVAARLARMEIAAFLRELRIRVQHIRLVEPVVWSSSNFTRGPLKAVVELQPADGFALRHPER